MKIKNLQSRIVWKSLITPNVSSISGVHHHDEAKLCNKSHFTNKAD